MPVDVMRVESSEGEVRYSVCVAAYGYMGDLMRQSESLRWMGPSRYNVAGALTLARNSSYRLRISYLLDVSQR
jgi:ceramide kinase